MATATPTKTPARTNTTKTAETAPVAQNTPEAALAATEVVGAQNPDGTAKEAQTVSVAPPPGLVSEALYAAAPHPPAGAFVPKLKKILTLPLLKLKEGEPVYVKFVEKTFIGKDIEETRKQRDENAAAIAAGKTPPHQVKEPPIMANVINLPTGELVQIMLGKVLNGIMTDEYPNDSYVGRGFVIELTEKKRGRSGGNYNTYKVAELDL